MRTRIDELWEALRSQPAGHNVFRRVDEDHPLDLYAGIDIDGNRVLLLVSGPTPEAAPSAGAIEVTVHQREDGDFAIVIRLSRPELSDLFGRLCQDLADTTRAATKADGAGALLRRLHRWRRLLEPRHDRSLSEKELRGLLGELWVLYSLVLPRVGPVRAIQAWLGPLDAPQDFLIDGVLLEVKAVAPGSVAVPISSVPQLDSSEMLFVGIVTISPATEQTAGAFTPAVLLARIRAGIEMSEPATNEFALRMAETGYDENAEYTREWFVVPHTTYYRVLEGFPRLRSADVPNGVVNVSYEIVLTAIAEYAELFPLLEAGTDATE